MADLHANAVGPTVGGLLTSNQLMIVATTSTTAVTTAEALSGYAPDQRADALMLLVILTGAFLLLFGVWGSLFFAGARTLQENLPDPSGAEGPVVVLRLRGRAAVGATLIEVLDDYARRLARQDGGLYLSGAGEELAGQFRRSGKLLASINVHIVLGQPVVGATTRGALTDARRWVSDHEDRPHAPPQP